MSAKTIYSSNQRRMSIGGDMNVPTYPAHVVQNWQKILRLHMYNMPRYIFQTPERVKCSLLIHNEAQTRNFSDNARSVTQLGLCSLRIVQGNSMCTSRNANRSAPIGLDIPSVLSGVQISITSYSLIDLMGSPKYCFVMSESFPPGQP